MSNVYESIMTGLNEAVEDSKSYEKKLTRRVVTVIDVYKRQESDRRHAACQRPDFL